MKNDGCIAILISCDGLRRAIRLPEVRYTIHTACIWPLTAEPFEPKFAMSTTMFRRRYVIWKRKSKLVYEYREMK